MADAPERINRLEYEKNSDGQEIKEAPFFDNPAEFLVARIVDGLRAIDEWKLIFGDSIDSYKRMDYSVRQLPALRVYNDQYNKDFDSWFIDGDVKIDVILPASIRRNEQQQLQDTLSGAIVQQFRRPTFFNGLMDSVPGLYELGKRVLVDKSLGFEWDETEVPLTQITLNFRLDLRVWDLYLEQTNRTKDEPFTPVLADLKLIKALIDGLKDDNETTEVEIGVDVTT